MTRTWRVNTSPYVGFTYEKKKQTKSLGFPTWASEKGLFSGQGEEAMGSLFSRARGGSEATNGDTDLFSEVKAATRMASTPGTPRAALPLPPNQCAGPGSRLCLIPTLRAYR